MIAVITGDIVNSTKGAPPTWLDLLKQILAQYGKSPKQWEIFRGDSFQLLLPPEKAVIAATHLKAAIKLDKNLDVRMGIGLGAESYSAERITESNGSAFIRSGRCFESLKKQNLAISTSDAQLDEILNLLFSLALLSMDDWSPNMAAVVKTALENSEKNQGELSEMLQKSQSSVSETMKRAGYEEVMQLNDFYQKQIQNL